MDAKIVETAKEKYGADKVRLVTTNGREFLVRAPARAEYKRYRQHAADPLKRADANEILVRACVVEPPPAEFTELLEELPAMCEEISEAVFDLAGMTGKAEIAKP